MARIYANENYPSEVVGLLRLLGHNVLTTHEAGRSNQRIPDDEVLAFAISEQRAVLTFNRKDFFKLHRISPVHAGIIACTEDSQFQALADRIHEAITLLSDDLDGKLIRINKPNS